MIKLYGFDLSNYYNMVKAGLLEKGIEFETVALRPSQESDYLGKSPMGKVPCIELDGQFLSETSVILEFLEDLQPTPALLPADPFRRAKLRELMRTLELYIELPARTCYRQVFFGETTPLSAETQQRARETLQRGVRALTQLAAFEPFMAGADLSYADLMGVYTLPIASRVTKQLWQWDLLGDLPGADAWLKQMNERPSIQTIRSAQRSALANPSS